MKFSHAGGVELNQLRVGIAVLVLTLGIVAQGSVSARAQSPVGPRCEHDAKTFRCVKYIRNYDADTVTVTIPGVHPLIGDKISVRVLGIDTPEIKGKTTCEKDKARTAQRLVESLLKNAKHIELQNVDRDKYFRILADVIVDGKSIKDLMIKNNLAYTYDGGTKRMVDWCQMRLPAGK